MIKRVLVTFIASSCIDSFWRPLWKLILKEIITRSGLGDLLCCLRTVWWVPQSRPEWRSDLHAVESQSSGKQGFFIEQKVTGTGSMPISKSQAWVVSMPSAWLIWGTLHSAIRCNLSPVAKVPEPERKGAGFWEPRPVPGKCGRAVLINRARQAWWGLRSWSSKEAGSA